MLAAGLQELAIWHSLSLLYSWQVHLARQHKEVVLEEDGGPVRSGTKDIGEFC